MDRKEEFLTKLQELLEEYGASISFTCGPCSDTHGLYDERMVIEMVKSQARSPWDTEEIFYAWGWGISTGDLKERHE